MYYSWVRACAIFSLMTYFSFVVARHNARMILFRRWFFCARNIFFVLYLKPLKNAYIGLGVLDQFASVALRIIFFVWSVVTILINLHTSSISVISNAQYFCFGFLSFFLLIFFLPIVRMFFLSLPAYFSAVLISPTRICSMTWNLFFETGWSRPMIPQIFEIWWFPLSIFQFNALIYNNLL